MLYIGKNRIHELEVSSTNESLKALALTETLAEGTLLTTAFQTGGKGQMGAKWESNRAVNFLGTFLLKPNVHLSNVYALNVIGSLAVKETVAEYVNGSVEIKWPNDVVVNGKKIAGILIENKITSGIIDQGFVGIGLNINQLIFKKHNRPATSIAKERGTEVSVEAVIHRLSFHLQQFYSLYKLKGWSTISFLYHQDLYLKGVLADFLVNGVQKQLTLQSVTQSGELQLYNEKGKIESYGLKEIAFLS